MPTTPSPLSACSLPFLVCFLRVRFLSWCGCSAAVRSVLRFGRFSSARLPGAAAAVSASHSGGGLIRNWFDLIPAFRPIQFRFTLATLLDNQRAQSECNSSGHNLVGPTFQVNVLLCGKFERKGRGAAGN